MLPPKEREKGKFLLRQCMYLSWHEIKQNVLSYTKATHSKEKSFDSTENAKKKKKALGKKSASHHRKNLFTATLLAT